MMCRLICSYLQLDSFSKSQCSHLLTMCLECICIQEESTTNCIDNICSLDIINTRQYLLATLSKSSIIHQLHLKYYALVDISTRLLQLYSLKQKLVNCWFCEVENYICYSLYNILYRTTKFHRLLPYNRICYIDALSWFSHQIIQKILRTK